MSLTWPLIFIEISFNSDAIPVFKQDDADWDSGTGTWLGTNATWTDVTPYVLGFGYARGRQRQLARIEAGSAYLTLDNADGRFDPENASSPYYGSGAGMRPGKHVRIYTLYGGFTYELFYGMIATWKPEELNRSGSPTVRVEVSDAIAWIARGDFSWDYGSALSGVIVGFMLQEVLKISATAFTLLDPGAALVQDAPAATGNPWSEIQTVAESEEGLVFVNGAGKFVYHDHNHRFTRERSIVLQAEFDTDPTAIADGAVPFTHTTFVGDETEFYTRVTTTRAGGTPQTITIDYFGDPLPDRFFVREYSRAVRSFSDVSAQSAARRLADRFRSLFVDHHLRQHTDVTIEAGGGPAALWPVALGLEISDQVQVTERLYPGARSRSSRAFVEGMSVDVDMDRLSWKTTFRLSRALSAYFWNIKGKGVAFPSFPLTNDLYYREDLDILAFYDGFRWLTVNEYSSDFQPWTGLQPYAANASAYLYATRQDYDYYVTRWQARVVVNTTNNGSNYWTIALTRDGTTIASANTSTGSPGTVYLLSGVVGSVQDPISYFAWDVTKTGAPGTLNMNGSFSYRLVIT